MPKKPDSNKPSTKSAIIGWGITVASSSPFAFLFGNGYRLNNTYFDGNGHPVLEQSAMIGPSIGLGALGVFIVSDITFKFVGRGYRKLRNVTTSVPTEQELQAAKRAEAARHSEATSGMAREESRREIKAREKREQEVRAAGWDTLRKHHESLILEWSKYETDVALMIDYPIMTDYTDPVVHNVIAAMQEIRTAQMRAEDETAIDAPDSLLFTAVNKFELAFRAAERYARKQGQTHLDPREQRKLAAARQALNIILDGDSPAFEVEAAYKSLRSNLKGIIDVPDRAIAELETLVRREITAVPMSQKAQEVRR